MPPSDSRRAAQVYYGLACALLVTGCILVFGEQMGTHRLPIHVLAIVLAAGFCMVGAPREGEGTLEMLGLSRPRCTGWTWVVILAGVASGVGRYVWYRATGLGGVRLYEQAFCPLLRADSVAESAARLAVFLVGAYLAVLVPGLLFWSIIQEPLSLSGMFALGLVLQSSVFGLAHCYMTGTFDLVYGAEAFLGSFVSGIVYQRLKNVTVPALLMSSSIATTTFLLCAAA